MFGGQVQQSHVAQALKVRTHGVGVQPQCFGDLGSRERPSASGQLHVDGVTGVVSQCLEEFKLARSFTGSIAARRRR